ncbi:hypothetical protein CCY01nite_09670 [Chitinophaga cymbidii]|uniref:Beta-galactosidase n=1 Tax=Chitinophaga cymbidii TaxID=1096750 RepID=A0A512RG63_9BACT|nr:hypothetical protein CCY01nite_09670 [Chitinophaga cymbidii]
MKAQETDKFAAIGNKVPAVRTHLLEQPVPAPLPFIELPTENRPSAAFRPMEKLDTEEELRAALDSMRKKFMPFMRDLAPAIPQTRIKVNLDSFAWKQEKGKADWQQVRIPHYGEPLGKAITFYRTGFDVTPEMLAKGAVFIHFKGVDYKARVFVNQQYVGSHEGVFAPFEFDITRVVAAGKNEILVRVENDEPMQRNGDKLYAATGPGYDEPQRGWHHCPPGMGIYQQVYVEARSSLHIHDVFVRPIRNSDTAEVWLEVNNTSTSRKTIAVQHALYGQNFNAVVYEHSLYKPSTVQVPGVGDLAKTTDNVHKELQMGSGVNFLRFRIHIPGARRWNNETPWLYQLQLTLLDEKGNALDARKQSFGMRSFRMDTLHAPKGSIYLNEAPIRLRGANTMGAFQQSVMNGKEDQLIDDILLAKLTNMNFIRMTQMPVQEEIYDHCDRLGLMTQTDLPLFGVLRRNRWIEAVRQAEEMERLVRSHPCNVIVTYINERFPNAEGNPQRHLNTYEEFERFFTAADQAVLMSNPDRVIKAGDGDYDPPSPGLPDNHCYNGWYNGHGLGLGEMFKGYWIPVKPGWNYACGEFGSEGLESVEIMRKYYPAAWLPRNREEERNWSPSKIPAAQTGRFHYMWYNTQHSLEDWAQASQQHQATITQLTTEAFRRNDRMVSFAIHLFIDAFPAGWMKAIMDVDRKPKKAWYAYRDALSPLAVQLRTDRFQAFSRDTVPVEAWIVNDLNQSPAGHVIRYQLEMNGRTLFSNMADARIEANRSTFQGFIPLRLPRVTSPQDVTLRIALCDPVGKPLHESSVVIKVYPRPAAERRKVWLARKTGPAAVLAEEMKWEVVEDAARADALLVDDISDYNSKYDALVAAGKTMLLLQASPGEYNIAGKSFAVNKCSMGSYYFVSPLTGHPMMKGCAPLGFRFWYDGGKQLIRPLMENMIKSADLTEIISTDNISWGKSATSGKSMAVAEAQYGKGRIRICQLLLQNRVLYNPEAWRLASKLVI